MLDVKPTMGENWKCEMVGKGAFEKIEPYKERHDTECSPKESDVRELGSSLCVHATPLLCLLMETPHPWGRLLEDQGMACQAASPVCCFLSLRDPMLYFPPISKAKH